MNLDRNELLSLYHNYDHRAAFLSYIRGARLVKDKQAFLFRWISPCKNDSILECGSSGGKTAIDLVRRSGCYCIGIDFDVQAVKISTEMRDEYFPELGNRCHFEVGDLTSMKFGRNISKVVMADFSEHVPDEILQEILANISAQLPNVQLYLYTPSRSHIFEIMKHHNFILKKSSVHVNVKTAVSLVELLKKNNWKILNMQWRISHFPIFRGIEFLLGHLPIIGKFFRRRIAIVATPDHTC